MKKLFLHAVFCLFFAGLFFSPNAKACIIGDPNLPPEIEILSDPGNCCYGSWAGYVTGKVNNVNTDSVGVVVFAKTDYYYPQKPFGYYWLTPDCNGNFSGGTYGGRYYCAFLAKKSWNPSAILYYLPAVSEPIVAIACSTLGPRYIDFGGYRWQVKEFGNTKFEPGPNYWSDSEENVWVDGQGLHLKITFRDGKRLCPEVMTTDFLSNGIFQYELASPVDALAANVVFSGFLYNTTVDEYDIEWSKSLACLPQNCLTCPHNMQFCSQPWNVAGNCLCFQFSLTGQYSSHEINWQSNKVTFASFQGRFSALGPLIQSWTYTGPDIPQVSKRFHFNLWLVNGQAPGDGQEVEVIITAFVYPGHTISVQKATWGGIKSLFR
ncbi:MAG: hypothetical protein WC528_01545 [Patescibacteria group bacterium]